MSKAVKGIYAAAISPLCDDGTLDAKKLVDYCKYLVTEGGCDGVAPMGTTGEGNSISFREKIVLAEMFAKVGFEPNRVILGTGSCATHDAVELTRAALDAGFPNVLVLPPFYYKSPSSEGIFSYFARLIEAIGDARLRLYLYHFPQMSATPIPVDVVVRLQKEFGAMVAGLKDSSGDITQALDFATATGGVDADFDVYPSSEALIFEGAKGGCAGIISGSTNAFAQYVQAARQDGADSSAFKLAQSARAVVSNFPLVAAMKQIEAWRSGDETWLRMAPPLTPLNKEQQRSLKAEIARLGFS